jgi:hypothetical protein
MNESNANMMSDMERKEFIQSLREGDSVYWYDPDDDTCSGVYTVGRVYDLPGERCEETIIVIHNNRGSEVEAYMEEITYG